jgi:hypothetical protein
VKVSCALSNETEVPSALIGAFAKPDNITSSSKSSVTVFSVENFRMLISIVVVFQAE